MATVFARLPSRIMNSNGYRKMVGKTCFAWGCQSEFLLNYTWLGHATFTFWKMIMFLNITIKLCHFMAGNVKIFILVLYLISDMYLPFLLCNILMTIASSIFASCIVYLIFLLIYLLSKFLVILARMFNCCGHDH